MPGCCVVTLNEGEDSVHWICFELFGWNFSGVLISNFAGNKPIDEILLDASTIAIVCWKGKTNLSIMVSQLDAQELRERLSIRFPSEVTISEDKENNSNSEAEAKKISVDNESTDDFEAEPDNIS